jgi:type IX secretion system substrate protein
MAPPFSTPYDLELSEMSVAENLPDSSFVADVLVEDEDPNNTYSFTCMGAYSIFLDDYGPASFFVEDGKLFTDKVFVYDDDNPDYNNKFLRIIVEDQYGNEYMEDFEIAIEKVYTGPTGIFLSDSSVMENKPVGTAVAKVNLENEESSNSYTYTLYGAYNTDISDYDLASFYMDGDSLKTSLVFDRNLADTAYLLVEVLDAHENQLSRAFTIQIQSNQSGSTGINHISLEDDLLYPNPADRFVTLRNTGQNSSLEFYEITGRKIATMKDIQGTIDVSELNEGIYLVVIRSDKGTALQKLLIQR